MDTTQRLLTIDELAAYLSVPKSWVYSRSRERKRTGFPVIKVGKYLRFDRQQIEAWLARQRD